MLNLGNAALKVFLALDPCDMRKSFNGLHPLAADHLQLAPAHPSGKPSGRTFSKPPDSRSMKRPSTTSTPARDRPRRAASGRIATPSAGPATSTGMAAGAPNAC
jgi:hypothetical protein